MRSAMAPGRNSGSGEALAKVLSAYFAAKGMRNAEGMENAIRERKEEQTRRNSQLLADAYRGTLGPGTSNPGPYKTEMLGGGRDALLSTMMTIPEHQGTALEAALAPKKDAGFTLGKDQVRFSSDGRELARGPVSPTTPGDRFGDTSQLRSQFTKGAKDFIDMRDSFKKINTASDNAQGDMSLIFGFMKLLDPGSTVREGEFASAEQTTGLPGYVVNLYNRSLSGERLNPEQRAGFKNEAYKLFDAQRGSHIASEGEYRRLARASNLDPDQVIVDYLGDLRDFTFQPGKVDSPVDLQALSQKPLNELTDEEIDILERAHLSGAIK